MSMRWHILPVVQSALDLLIAGGSLDMHIWHSQRLLTLLVRCVYWTPLVSL